MSFDLGLERLINGLAGRSRLLDAVMVAFAQYSPLVLALILLVVYFAPDPRRRWRRLVAIYAGAAALVALAVSYVIGLAWYRPRPFVADPTLVHALVAHANDSSFPSDHATLAFAIALGLWSLGPAWGPLLLALGVVVAFARVFVGVHWPTDVLAGAILGGLAGWLLPRLAQSLNPYLNRLLDALGPLGQDAPPASENEEPRPGHS